MTFNLSLYLNIFTNGTFVVPDGAMYIFARVNQEGFDGVQFANDTLEKGLAVAPGEGFGDYKNFIRIFRVS